MRSFMKRLLGHSGAQHKDEAHSHAEGRKQERHGRDYKNLEDKYQKILGVTNADSPTTIKEKYRDLIVRVAGYSDYFCDLSAALQDEIITRTEHAGF